MKKEFNGKLMEGYEWNELIIGDDILSNEVDIFDGYIIGLRYYISNKPIDKDTAVEKMLETFYKGASESDGTYMYGSTWTGCYGKNDEFSVGGHDIIKELTSHLGKYCYLIIETEENE